MVQYNSEKTFLNHSDCFAAERGLQELLKLATLLYSASRAEEGDFEAEGGGGSSAVDEAEPPLISQVKH